MTVSTPETDRYGYDENYLRGRIIGALGGMAAEDVIFGVVTTGAESDLETSTRIARSMVGRWGMSERVGPISALPPDGDPRMAGASEAMLDAVDEEVRRIVDECYAEAREQLRKHRDQLDAIVAQLLEHETLDEAEAYAAADIVREPDPEATKTTAAAAAPRTGERHTRSLRSRGEQQSRSCCQVPAALEAGHGGCTGVHAGAAPARAGLPWSEGLGVY